MNRELQHEASKDGADGLDDVLADYMQRVDRGEPVDEEALINAHPMLATELRAYFSQALAVDRLAVGADGDANADTKTFFHQPSETRRRQLEVRCPNCHTPMKVAVDAQLTELSCDSCGSKFSLLDPNQDAEVVPLSTIGRFDLIARLGMGAFGVVWKARDKELGRLVAIKVPRRGGMNAADQEEFLSEARAAAQLRHPNIVSVHEVGRDGDSVYIVSDFIAGMSLDKWLTGKKLTVREAAEMCVKIATGLHHAHEHGIVHRDLKPANIMMDDCGEPHVTDFGLARQEAAEMRVSLDGVVIGTPAYMSPEQAQGEGNTADRRSDVYSLGVMLFEMLTNELPFRGNLRMLLEQVIKDEPPSPRKFNANVPKDLETITLKCLEKASANRYQTADEFSEELRCFLRGEPVRSRPVSKLERAWRWSKRRPAAAGLIAAGVLSLFAIGAWGLREIGHAYELRLQLSDNLIKSAQLHGRTGEWKDALRQLDEAREWGTRDSVSLRLQRVRVLIALSSPEANSEIAQLARRDDLGPHEADVRLLQGLDLLATSGLPAAMPLFQQAKAAGTLSLSDNSLVDGLAADTTEQALDHFRKSVDLAPFSQEARRFLVLMLSSTGRFEEAVKQAEVGQAFFPDDPNFPLLLAYVDAGAGNRENIEGRFVAKSLRQIDPSILKSYGEALKDLASMHQESAELWDFALMSRFRLETLVDPQQQKWLLNDALDDTPSIFDNKAENLLNQLESIRAITTPLEQSQAQRSTAEIAQLKMTCGPKCLIVAYEPIRDLFSLRTQGYLREGKGSVARIDRLIDRLAVSSQAHPDSFLSYMRGLLLFVRGRLDEAAEAFAAGEKQFSSFGGFDKASSFAAARCNFERFRNGIEGALERAVEHMRTRLDQGPLRPRHAAAMYEIAMAGKDFDSARRLVNSGSLKPGAEEKRLLILAKIEMAAENYLEALRLVEKVPAVAAERNDAETVRRQCLEKLNRITQDYRQTR